DAGMDTGELIAQEQTTIFSSDTSETLHDRLAQMGANLLVRTIPGYIDGTLKPRPQPAEGISYAPKITRAEGRLDWTEPARALWNRVRGLVPWPGAYTRLLTQPGPPLLKIWETAVIDRQAAPGEIIGIDDAGIVVGCGRGA